MVSEFQHLGKALRILRQMGGLSQQEVVSSCARSEIGISQGMLSRWERGGRLPGLERLGPLLHALEASLEDVHVLLTIYERFPPDEKREPATEAELEGLPRLDRLMRLFIDEQPGSLRSRLLFHVIKTEVLTSAIGEEGAKLADDFAQLLEETPGEGR